MSEHVYVWRLRDRWWYLVSAILGLVMGYSGSFIEGNNADLMTGNPTSGDGGYGLWGVLLVSGIVLVSGSLIMFVLPRRSVRS